MGATHMLTSAAHPTNAPFGTILKGNNQASQRYKIYWQEALLQQRNYLQTQISLLGERSANAEWTILSL